MIGSSSFAPLGRCSLTLDPVDSVHRYVSANARVGNRKAQRTTFELTARDERRERLRLPLTHSGVGAFAFSVLDLV